MKLTIILSMMLFMAGCTGVSYYHEYSSGDKIKINYSNCNIKLMTEGLKITLSDGATMELGKREQIPDANSALAIGKAIGAGIGAATVGGMLK